MALICDETGKYIEYGEILMAGTRKDVGFFSALSQEVLTHIPESKKRTTCCKPSEGGVDIHHAESTRNWDDSYTLVGFNERDFAFSISQETAEQFLPNHLKRYPPAPTIIVE